METERSRGVPWVAVAAVVAAALLARVPLALRAYQPSPDAAEYLLLARSLAAGRGFVLPIQVRYVPPGPVVHEAWGERAPLWPWLLSWPVRAGCGAAGWPDPRLQLLPAALGALGAGLAALLAAALARRRGLAGRSLAVATWLGGLGLAWAPPAVRATTQLWAEPLGGVLVLIAALLWLELGPEERGPPRRALTLGTVAALARFARPEAWVLVPLLLGWAALRKRWGTLAALAGPALLVNGLGLALTGVVAPQLFLLGVGGFEEAMRPGAAPTPPGLLDALRGAAGNLSAQLGLLLLPRQAFLTLPLVLLAWRWRTARRPLLLAVALLLATAAVWSTRDPSRFAVLPLGLLAPVAGVELEALRKRLAPGRAPVLAVVVAAQALLLGHHAGRYLRRPPAPPPALEPAPPGEAPLLADPWSYALLLGRPARLAAAPPG